MKSSNAASRSRRPLFTVPAPAAVPVALCGPLFPALARRPRFVVPALALLAGVSFLAAGPTARAATEYWEPTGTTGTNATGSWSTVTTTLNWDTSSAGTAATTFWTNGNDAIFSADPAATALSTVTLSTAITANSLTFGNSGAVGSTTSSSGATGGYTFTNGNTLTLGTATGNTLISIASGVGPVTFQGAVSVPNGTNQTYTLLNNSANALTFGSTFAFSNGNTAALALTGSGGITFNGAINGNNTSGGAAPFTINLTGSNTVGLNAANTAAGQVVVNGTSTLSLGNALALQGFNLSTTTGSTVTFNTLTAATIGGLTGSGTNTITLTNTANAAVALTLEGEGGTSNSIGGGITSASSPTFAGSINGLGGLTVTSVTLSNRANGGTATFSGVLSFGGGLAVTNTGSAAPGFANSGNATVVLTNADTYAGATSVANSGTLTISGNGASTGSSGYAVSTGGLLQLTPGTAMTGNELNTAANVTLSGLSSQLALTGNTTNNVTQSFNALAFDQGGDTITITGATGKVTTLAANATTNSFVRTNNATLLIRGTNLSQTATTGVSRFTLGDGGASLGLVGTNTLNNGATADATQALKISPFIFGDTSLTGAGTNFVTYDTTLGIRLLTTAEDTALAAASATATNPVNATVTGTTALTATSLAVNSLLFTNSGAALSGANTAFTVNSGAVALNVTAGTIGGFTSFTLGNGEGVLTTPQGDTLTVSTALGVSGGGGLTKAGTGTLIFGAGTSTYAGATTVDLGTLQVNAGANIASSSGITLDPGTTLTNSGTIGALTVSAPATAANAGTTATLATLNGGSVTGAITDNGTVTVAGTTAVTTGAFSGTGATGLINYTNTLTTGNTISFTGTNSFLELNNTAAGGLLTLTGTGSNNTFALFPEANAGLTTTSTTFQSGTYNFTAGGSNVNPNNLGTFTVAGATVNFLGGLRFMENGGGTVKVSSGVLSSQGNFDTNQQASGATVNVVVSGSGTLDVRGSDANIGNEGAEAASTLDNLNVSGGLFQVGITGSATARNLNIGGSNSGISQVNVVAAVNLSGGTIRDNGTIKGAGTPLTAGANTLNLTGGTLTAGTIDMTSLGSNDGTNSSTTGTLYNGGTIIAPGYFGQAVNSTFGSTNLQFTGRTLFTGIYQSDSPNAALAFNLGGTTAAGGFGVTAADYDNIAVTGTANLGTTTGTEGRLNVGLINSYTPPSNTTQLYNVLTASTALSGTFSNLVTGNSATTTGGTSRVVLADGLSSMLVGINTTAAAATTDGLAAVPARTVSLGGYQATNTYNAATTNAWDAPAAADWTNFDPGSTAAPATQASGAIAQFADGANTGTGANVVSLNSTRNIQGVQFSSTVAGHNYTINDAGNATGAIILDNTANGAAATIADSSATGNANAVTVPITLNSALAVSVTNATNTLTLGGVLSGAQPLTKTGLGTLILSNANTYSGTTTIGNNAGNIEITNASALGTGGVALTATNGQTSAGTLQIAIAGGTIAAPNVIANNITGNSQNPFTNANPGTANIENVSGSNKLTGTYTLTGTGGTGQNIVTDAGSNLQLAGALTVNGPTGTRGFDFGGAGNTQVSGVISNGTANAQVLKDGSGTLTLSGANTYTGVTQVNSGTLLVTGSTAAGSAVTVGNAAGTLTGTLGGTGTVSGTVRVNSGSILSAGAGNTPGTLTTGMLTLATGSTFNAVLLSDTSISQLAASGTTDLSPAAFSLTLAPGADFALADGGSPDVLTLIPSAVTGNFTNGSFTTGGYTFTADYTTTPGQFDVDITSAVPEPSTWIGGLLAVLSVLGLSRRRRKAA